MYSAKISIRRMMSISDAFAQYIAVDIPLQLFMTLQMAINKRPDIPPHAGPLSYKLPNQQYIYAG
ncbi:uncharacterized protein METZ01_LOCUS17762 [marine metagenome]|uniref:Uncharacterized protein n=1 Tax=marine metagenome TaxID=408172 RepID=A0A381PEX8_9ZZZZ|tara:strand:+ start:145 stop:339 length:195 start_codon:yes stop_codon:yes gene_type:complete